MENSNPNTSTSGGVLVVVQHVAKSSSDELLRKFADPKDIKSKSCTWAPKECLRLAKRLKTTTTTTTSAQAKHHKESAGLADAKSLLLLRKGTKNKSRRLARHIDNRSIIAAIHKTWRRTVEGASRVLVDKHYNRHTRLINYSS